MFSIQRVPMSLEANDWGHDLGIGSDQRTVRSNVVRIRLIAIDAALARIVDATDEAFANAYGATLGASKAVVAEVVAQTLALVQRAPRAPEWGGYLVADCLTGRVVGTCGFKHGPEADGSVEIAYFTFPAFERRGYATAMARELLRRSLQSDAVREVIAHTLPEHNASTRILEKVGLQFAGEIEDPEDGRIWRWRFRPKQDRE